ncbi:MAG: hypothetical protein ACM3X6_13410 [Patescibacteria group bacterium]
MAIALCERRVTMAKDRPDCSTPSGESEPRHNAGFAPVSNAVGGAILGTAIAGTIGAVVGGVIGAGTPYAIKLFTGRR